MLNGLLEVIGAIASLIGIWEFVSRREFPRRLAGRISHLLAKKARVIHRRQVDPFLVDRITLFDPDGIAETNMNRHVVAGSYRRQTCVVPGNHDIDIVAALR